MKVLILAGGKGTRLGKMTEITPKPLIPIKGKPVLEYQIQLLKKNNLCDITILINHLGERIKEYFGDGKRWGVNISYFEETFPLGTCGGIKMIEKELKEDFLVLYGDLLLNVDFKKLIKQHKKNKQKNRKCIGTLMVHPNNHPYDSDLVEINEQNEILNFLSKPHPEALIYKNLVNAAVYVLSPTVCSFIPPKISSDFGKDIFPMIIKDKKSSLYAYNSPEYLKDMGTPERLLQAETEIRNGVYQKSVLSIKRPAIFLDRDGVINKEIDQLHKVEDFELIKNVGKAIREINENGYYAIVITNQPMIAKGFCTYEDVIEINKKMETELGKVGAKIDAIYLCPHHPDKGFSGENKKYKMKCSCRKPGIGMIKKAVKDLNIDLENSFFIGDSTTDAMTAKNAKIRFIGVKTGYGCNDHKFSDRIKISSDQLQEDLYTAIKKIMS